MARPQVQGLRPRPCDGPRSAHGGRPALGNAADTGLIDVLWLDRCPLLDLVRGDARVAPVRAQVQRRAGAILDAYRAV